MSKHEEKRAKVFINLLHEKIIMAEDTISVVFKSEPVMNSPVFDTGKPYPAGQTKYSFELILADKSEQEISGD